MNFPLIKSPSAVFASPIVGQQRSQGRQPQAYNRGQEISAESPTGGQPHRLELHDRVVFKIDVPRCNVKSGMRGAIVELYSRPPAAMVELDDTHDLPEVSTECLRLEKKADAQALSTKPSVPAESTMDCDEFFRNPQGQCNTLQQHDRVVFATDVPGTRLKAGMRGAIVELCSQPPRAMVELDETHDLPVIPTDYLRLANDLA